MRLSQSYDFGLSLSVCSLPIRFLSSASLPVLATQPSVSSFPLLPRFASQLLVGCCLLVFRLPCFSTSVPPGFPCFPFVSSYSALCLFPFIPPGFAPTAVPPVLPFCSRFRAFPFRSAFFRPLLFRFWLLSLCFFLSALPGSASQLLPRCALSAFASLAFPVLSDLVSRVFLPDSCTRLC